MYTATYQDGSSCGDKKRKSHIIFYCDQYADEKDKSFKILDAAEVDTCEYSFKVSTRFMCQASSLLPKALAKSSITPDAATPILSLDAMQQTQRKHLNCNIQSDF